MANRSTVLLLENDDLNAAILGELLVTHSRETYQVKRCKFLVEAVRELSRTDYATALISLNPPDSAGLNTLFEIIAIAGDASVIVIGDDDHLETALKSLEMGAQDFIPRNAIDAPSLERVLQYGIRRKQKEKRLTAKAYSDTLTGLGNRSLLYERWRRCLSRALRAKRKTGVLVIDVDNFKQINDAHGHHAGDLLLQDLSARIKTSVRDTDVVARLGGDEFVIVLENICSKGEIDAVRNTLMDETNYTFLYDGVEISYEVSIGGTISDPAEKEDLMFAMRRADQEMYENKSIRKQTNDHLSKRLPIPVGS